jgi:hypothetical protein
MFFADPQPMDVPMSSYPQPDPSFAVNMNPSLSLPPGHVHVMNLNMVPQFNQGGNSDQFTLTDPGILDTIPAQLLYEWSESNFLFSFSRFR